MQQLLYSKNEAMQMLGVGEKVFNALALSFVRIGKRKKYAIADLQACINKLREPAPCLGPGKEKDRPTTGTTSRSTVIGFEEAQRLIASRQLKASSQSCAVRR
ncbi:MAG: hypothetical protein CMM93_05735 [Rickettsiales bacterium]|nr:hypothetical protein [Rickettsiales bacterium]|tara:strand:+ start:651 stop:959 length:309 start_codon:yes stop_codon:yes gene_type:complete